MKIAGIFKKQDESASSGNRASAEQISEETVNDIIEELSELEDDGVLQRPMEEYIRDEKFSKLISEFPVKASVRIYDAEAMAQEAAEKGRQSAIDDICKRKQMPKPMIANKSAEPETDFTKLSSEEFAKLKQRLAQGR